MACVSEFTALAYTGDGTCDDGTYGYDLTCAEFSFDDGDCDGAVAAEATAAAAALATRVARAVVYDCSMTCVSESTALSYTGDVPATTEVGLRPLVQSSPSTTATATGAAAAEATAEAAASVTPAARARSTTAP